MALWRCTPRADPPGDGEAVAEVALGLALHVVVHDRHRPAANQDVAKWTCAVQFVSPPPSPSPRLGAFGNAASAATAAAAAADPAPSVATRFSGQSADSNAGKEEGTTVLKDIQPRLGSFSSFGLFCGGREIRNVLINDWLFIIMWRATHLNFAYFTS